MWRTRLLTSSRDALPVPLKLPNGCPAAPNEIENLQLTALTLRAEIGRFDRFQSGKQLARFCGVTPWNASSGERQADAGLIKAGNRELRRVLIEAAHRLKRHSERWSELSEKAEGQREGARRDQRCGGEPLDSELVLPGTTTLFNKSFRRALS
ncbi:MAG: IS110 family transposase [Planctomycetota bacterium]